MIHVADTSQFTYISHSFIVGESCVVYNESVLGKEP